MTDRTTAPDPVADIYEIPLFIREAIVRYQLARDAYSHQYDNVATAKVSLNYAHTQREKAKAAMMVAIQTPDRM